MVTGTCSKQENKKISSSGYCILYMHKKFKLANLVCFTCTYFAEKDYIV